ncbi:MAG: DUF4339 domain-containing protein [Terriglobales bacterium]|jgi:hypothetical protein
MNYFISRNDQQYGPYTLADLQRYVASGSILVTDMIQSQPLRPKRIDDQHGLFVGAREPFLQFIDSHSQSAFGTGY